MLQNTSKKLPAGEKLSISGSWPISKKNGTVRGNCIACDALLGNIFVSFTASHRPFSN